MPLLNDNKFDPNKDIPDLNGKVYVVTGGSAGIGFGVVAHLLQHNASKIYLLSNKEEHAEEAQEGLKKYGDVSRVEWKKCNLQDLKQVDQVAKDLSKLEKLDGLILNAGLGVGVYNETEDGIDSHMQVNHISQFHLAMTLLPVLQRTPHSRLVLQSSEFHRLGVSDVHFASLEELNTDIGATKLYARTKLANVLFVRALARHAARNELGFTQQGMAQGPWINATHPGGVRTDQQDQAVEAYGKLGDIAVKVVRPFMKDPVDEGCRPALFAATSKVVEEEGMQGLYMVPDRKVEEPSKEAKDEELGEALWLLTERLLMDRVGPLDYGPVHVDNMARDGLHGSVS
ncbi:Short-chain dehydrogenase/reductase SDR [Neofusicoccum parvum]|uniref:Short-chain dehydrogenase/reductase SDR n=1 Tax=Neofusicoccum parvum TaxID=310453 RepID=A0ACB5SKX8_9PEZI|nr:Short-chain dehydrogenase/reductase SDR [Neofusicoccum parvum]